MSASFTPGPWFTDRLGYYHGTIYVEARLRGSLLQEVAACGPCETPSQQEANARLISSAPDLLEALDLLLNDVGRASSLPGARLARAAILKATGGQP